MASDCAHEETSVFVQFERFDQSVKLMFVLTAIKYQFPQSRESQDWWLPKSSEVILLKTGGEWMMNEWPLWLLVKLEPRRKFALFISSSSQRIFLLPKTLQNIGYLDDCFSSDCSHFCSRNKHKKISRF